ncbi:MAG: glycerol-3-phosphate dehydrogenase/oxidase [Leptospira sp.]|nr:glycerol-3-phosphate dehydrogenase/oxidase [Leptospira sp.]
MLNPTKLEKERTKSIRSEYDIVIIGGGITGACALWDATLRGYSCLLVEKNDYASGTSQATSKLIHGGLRYLKNLEFSLVRESLRERRYLAKISPHGVSPLGFIIPIRSIWTRIQLFLGMELYNLLSFDRNVDIHQDSAIPKYRWNSKLETLYKIPNMIKDKLLGSFQYYDYANINPERHTSEFIFSAKEKGAHAFNYMSLTTLKKQNSGGYTVGIKDNLTGKEKLLSAKVVINSAGPWADFIENLLGVHTNLKIVRSKGIHVVVRKIVGNESVVLEKRDGSHLFVIPWRDRTIVGTTDSEFNKDPDDFSVTQSEIKNLLDEVNFSFGYSKLQLEDVEYFYGGLRPLVDDSNSNEGTYSASRKAEVVHYESFGYPGFYSALGGKYTTSRSVAEKLINQVDSFFGKSESNCLTKTEPVLGGRFKGKKELVSVIESKHPKLNGRKIETLVSRYGSTVHRILNLKGQDEYLLPNGEVYFEEEIEYIVLNEDIIHLTDFYFRRSGFGTVGKPSSDNFNRVNQKISKLLGWSVSRLKEEVKQVNLRYKWALD